MNKKILFFIPRMGNGGAERVMATLANELVERDYEVLILTLTTDESFYKLKKKVKIIGANYQINKENKLKRWFDMFSNGCKSLIFFYKIVRSWRPDVTVSFLTHTNIISLLVKLIIPKLKLIVSERAEPRERGQITQFVTKKLYPKANVIVCQSELVSKFFLETKDANIRVIENPVNEEAIPETLPNVRRKVIVGIGRLFPQKNFDLLIDSFNEISKDFPEYKLEIYGEGFLREKLQNKIDSYGISERVTLMGVKHNVMKTACDSELFVLSSDFEGFPNALVEAMASGLPVISTDFSTGVARDLIGQENGIIVPVRDQFALTKAMRTILSNYKLRVKMGKNNRKLKDQLSIDKILSKWVNIFEEI